MTKRKKVIHDLRLDYLEILSPRQTSLISKTCLTHVRSFIYERESLYYRVKLGPGPGYSDKCHRYVN